MNTTTSLARAEIAPGNGAFITIRNLKRYYRMGGTIVKALDGVDLDVERGELLCLMGPSGSGKSTLLNLLGGLDTPDDGTIMVAGRDISTLDENELAAYRRQSVGLVFQSFNLIPTMTALENVEFPMVFAGLSPAERRERAKEVLELVGLGDRINHRPTELSGGQQQRVAIARALVCEPALLLADEPTGNLDSRTSHEIMGLLVELNRAGLTIVMVTHEPDIAAYARREVRFRDGRILADERRSAA